MENEYFEVKNLTNFLINEGQFSEGQAELLKFIIWVTYLKNDLTTKEMFVYHSDWVNVRFFSDYTPEDMEGELGYLIELGVIEVILLENDKVGLYILSHGLFDLTQSIIEAKEDSLEDLKNELQEAIIGEDFEKAALIRDQIKELTGN